MWCLKSILPKTKTVFYKRKCGKSCVNVGKKPIDWKHPFFWKEDNSKGSIKGYRVPCGGDSGSGQVVSISIDSKPLQSFKYVLAAVFVKTIENNVEENGELVGMPCGSTAFRYDSNTRKVVTLQSQGLAQSTSWPEIFDWIKHKANI